MDLLVVLSKGMYTKLMHKKMQAFHERLQKENVKVGLKFFRRESPEGEELAEQFITEVAFPFVAVKELDNVYRGVPDYDDVLKLLGRRPGNIRGDTKGLRMGCKL